MKNFVQHGKVLDYLNETVSVIPSGSVVIVGSVAGIAAGDIAVDEVGAVNIEGVFSLTKDAPLVISQGDEVFWSTTNSEVTKTATDSPIGIAFNSAASADTTVNVKLYGQGNGIPVAATVAALVDNSGGSANSTLQVITAGTPADLAAQGVINGAIANNFADLAANNNAILAALKAAGLMA